VGSGPRTEDLKGAPRNERSSANAVSKRRLAALGSEGVNETSTSMRPGWLAWAAFIFAWKSNSPRIRTDLGQPNAIHIVISEPFNFLRPIFALTFLKIVLRFPKILLRIHSSIC